MNALPLNLITVKELLTLMTTARRPDEPPSDTSVFELTFVRDMFPLPYVAETEKGSLILNHEKTLRLVTGYTQAALGITMLILLGFTVDRFTIIEANNHCGVQFDYRTPKGQIHSKRYIRDVQDLDIIPKDFLRDLQAIPKIQADL